MVWVQQLRTGGFLFCAIDVNGVGGDVIGLCFQVNVEHLQGGVVRVRLLRTSQATADRMVSVVRN